MVIRVEEILPVRGCIAVSCAICVVVYAKPTKSGWGSFEILFFTGTMQSIVSGLVYITVNTCIQRGYAGCR